MQQPFIVKRLVRFGDCDPGGVVYTPKIGYFVIESVLDFLADRLGGPAEQKIMDMGILPPARAMSIEFIKPMVWDDELEIHVNVKELRNSAIVFSVEAHVEKEVVFKAELTQVCVSRESRQPVAIPKAFREALL